MLCSHPQPGAVLKPQGPREAGSLGLWQGKSQQGSLQPERQPWAHSHSGSSAGLLVPWEVRTTQAIFPGKNDSLGPRYLLSWASSTARLCSSPMLCYELRGRTSRTPVWAARIFQECAGMSGLGERHRKREDGGEGSRAIWGRC